MLLGMTNLAKGVVFGTAMALIPIGGFLLLNGRIGPILRYCWLWGWLTFAAIALAWPFAVYQRFPDALPLWQYDLFGRLNGGYLAEPFWYYFGHWFWVVLPWPVAAIIGAEAHGGRGLQRAKLGRAAAVVLGTADAGSLFVVAGEASSLHAALPGSLGNPGRPGPEARLGNGAELAWLAANAVAGAGWRWGLSATSPWPC